MTYLTPDANLDYNNRAPSSEGTFFRGMERRIFVVRKAKFTENWKAKFFVPRKGEFSVISGKYSQLTI